MSVGWPTLNGEARAHRIPPRDTTNAAESSKATISDALDQQPAGRRTNRAQCTRRRKQQPKEEDRPAPGLARIWFVRIEV